MARLNAGDGTPLPSDDIPATVACYHVISGNVDQARARIAAVAERAVR